jgi:hypothetical protein
VCRLACRDLIVRLRLDRVHKVGELDGVLDEEHRDVVADNVPVALVGVELDSETADIANGVGTATGALDSGETDKGGGRTRGVGEDGSLGVLLGPIVVNLEDTVGTGTTSVDDTLGDALVIEAVDLFTADLVLEEIGAGSVAVDNSEPKMCIGQLLVSSIGKLIEPIVTNQLSPSAIR